MSQKQLNQQEEFRKLPSVDELLHHHLLVPFSEEYSRELLLFCIHEQIQIAREKIQKGQPCVAVDNLCQDIIKQIKQTSQQHLKPVINASGVIIHTNLGRAPLGESLIKDSEAILKGYSNLEFDLEKGKRGHRDEHLKAIFRFLTQAEDVLVVNNNAAALMFILQAFSKHKEVIVSRGELVEIGGSFRIPDIISSSDCIMREVGTTNKTKLSDYESACNEQTGVLLKTHQSNYSIKGFTEEVSLKELVALGKKHQLPVVYDIGSGLLKRPKHPALKDEPEIKTSIATGVDLLCFSGDKLLGGPQAGIIAGKKKWVQQLRKHPMMRALRVGKTTLALLESATKNYLNEERLFKNNLFFRILNQTEHELRTKAEQLQKALKNKAIDSEIEPSTGFFGGGTMPDKEIQSYSVMLKWGNSFSKDDAKSVYLELLKQDYPILSVLKSGRIYLDVLSVGAEEIDKIAEGVGNAVKKLTV